MILHETKIKLQKILHSLNKEIGYIFHRGELLEAMGAINPIFQNPFNDYNSTGQSFIKHTSVLVNHFLQVEVNGIKINAILNKKID